jgi:hypothetical protein
VAIKRRITREPEMATAKTVKKVAAKAAAKKPAVKK